MQSAPFMPVVLAIVWCADLVTAQAPDPWAQLQLSQPPAAHALRGQGKLVTYDDGTVLYVYSSATRTWHSTPKSPTAPMRLFNDCLVLFEPGSCRAFSAYSGQFLDLAVAGPATSLNSGSSKNDSIVLVADGALLHAFSAFTGEWTTRAMGNGFGVEVERHTAVFVDGNTIGGMSAFDGQWRERTTASPVQWIRADGTVACCHDGSTIYAFSAHHPGWVTALLPTGATFARGDDWVMWYGNGGALAFSGVRGRFASDPTATTGLAGQTDLYALLSSPSRLLAYSAFHGDFAHIPRTPNQIDFGAATALLHDSTGVRGYSAMRQRTARLPHPAIQSAAGTTLGYVTNTVGQCYVFSSYTAGWHAAPPSSIGQQPVLTTTTLAVATPNDCYAFDARHGQFVAAGAAMQALAANPTSAPLLGHNQNALFAFDTNAGRWLETPRQTNQPPIYRIWRTSALVTEGQHGYGIGAQAASFHHRLLPGVGGSSFANSEVAFVVQGTSVLACGMVGEIAPLQQFPHFRRVQPHGAELSLAIAAHGNALAFALLGSVSAPLPLPGFGELLLQPMDSIALPAPAPGTNGTGRVARLDLVVPFSASLAGWRLGTQLLALPASGSPWLGTLSTVELW